MTDTEAYAIAESDNLDLVASGNRFITEFENLPDVKLISPGLWMLHRVQIKLRVVNDDEIEIVSLNSVRRSGGFGSWALSSICEIADRTNTRLSLTPMPFDNSPMSVDTLRAWYERNGFKQCGTTERMVRVPVRVPKRGL